MSHAAHVEPWTLGEAMPAAMTAAQLMRVLQISERQFYRLKKAGKLKKFLIQDPVGPAIFSGPKVLRYVHSQPLANFGKGRAA